jgi:hypothetical protein
MVSEDELRAHAVAAPDVTTAEAVTEAATEVSS